MIHGHKHFTRLSYIDGVAVLASGSFSALLHEFGTSVGNTFHVVTVHGDSPGEVRGIVHTWVFRYGHGWRRSNSDHAGFPYLCGFGRQTPMADIISTLRHLASTDLPKTRFLEPQVLAISPDTEYLTPGERDEVNQALRSDDLKLADYDEGRLELWRSFRP